MPTAAKHPCLTPRCPALIPRGKTRCAACEREAELRDRTRRGSAHERGYDARWQKYRLAFLAAHPICVLCEAEGRVEPATVVDHERAHKGDQQLFWDPNNHRPVCKPHHDARTDEGDFGRAIPKGAGS